MVQPTPIEIRFENVPEEYDIWNIEIVIFIFPKMVRVEEMNQFSKNDNQNLPYDGIWIKKTREMNTRHHPSNSSSKKAKIASTLLFNSYVFYADPAVSIVKFRIPIGTSIIFPLSFPWVGHWDCFLFLHVGLSFLIFPNHMHLPLCRVILF